MKNDNEETENYDKITDFFAHAMRVMTGQEKGLFYSDNKVFAIEKYIAELNFKKDYQAAIMAMPADGNEIQVIKKLLNIDYGRSIMVERETYVYKVMRAIYDILQYKLWFCNQDINNLLLKIKGIVIDYLHLDYMGCITHSALTAIDNTNLKIQKLLLTAQDSIIDGKINPSILRAGKNKQNYSKIYPVPQAGTLPSLKNWKIGWEHSYINIMDRGPKNMTAFFLYRA